MTEAAKIRDTILPLVQNKTVLEIGCGSEKLVPWSVAVDHQKSPSVDIQVDVSPETKLLASRLGNTKFDIVFSSHALEHMRTPILETLRYWFSFVKVHGWMILYLPDERHYVFDPANPLVRNPEHHHYLTSDTFLWYMQQLAPGGGNCQMSMDIGPNRYSFLVILQKIHE